MIAGRLRYRLRLLKPVTTTGKFGDSKVSFELQRTVWAERVKVSPTLVQDLGELFSDYTVEWNVRDAHPVDEKWRVEQVGGHLYDVINVIPIRDKGMLTLRCKRVNT